jgi:uncharacterized metal-binding protein YceD (DUF177 family)
MPLLLNLRHVEEDNLELKGELSVEELELDSRDEMLRVEKPLAYDFEVQKLEDSLFLHGRLHLVLKCQCVRCLKSFDCELDLDDWTRHLPLEGEEKAAVVNDFVDLTPYLREDILLEFPQHPLCEADCRGLQKTNLSTAKKASDPEQSKQESSAWAELDKLKF